MQVIINEAYVTLVTSDNYVAGACVLARSLADSGTKRSIWCMATKSTLSDASISTLRSVFSGITFVETIDSGDSQNLALLGRPELGPTFTKLHLWQLVQFDKVVFLDADTLVLRNIDDLFEREELSACADVGWPDCFNSGVFVARPNLDTFAKLYQFAQEKGSFDGGDQGLLNSYFSDWSVGPSERRIPFTYNLTINASYSYAPAFARFRDDIRVVHFIGSLKPWTFRRSSDGSIVPRGDSNSTNLDFVLKWWAVYDSLAKMVNLSLLVLTAPISASNNYNIIKSYDNDNFVTDNNKTTKNQFGLNAESDFATYRIKWNADVEEFFKHHNNNNHQHSRIHKSPGSDSLSSSPALLNARLASQTRRHQSHPLSSSSKGGYRILGSNQSDESLRHYDDEYFTFEE